MNWLDERSLGVIVLIALTLGLAPYWPEPHLWEKLKMMSAGTLDEPLEVLDLILHGAPWMLLAAKLGRVAGHAARQRGRQNG
jgi:hypothetical protein